MFVSLSLSLVFVVDILRENNQCSISFYWHLFLYMYINMYNQFFLHDDHDLKLSSFDRQSMIVLLFVFCLVPFILSSSSSSSCSFPVFSLFCCAFGTNSELSVRFFSFFHVVSSTEFFTAHVCERRFVWVFFSRAYICPVCSFVRAFRLLKNLNK